MKRRLNPRNKAGKSTGGLSSPSNGLKESNKPRHYYDTTHNYGNFFGRELNSHAKKLTRS